MTKEDVEINKDYFERFGLVFSSLNPATILKLSCIMINMSRFIIVGIICAIFSEFPIYVCSVIILLNCSYIAYFFLFKPYVSKF